MNLPLSCSFIRMKRVNEGPFAFGAVPRIRTCTGWFASEEVPPYCYQMVSADLPSVFSLLTTLLALVYIHSSPWSQLCCDMTTLFDTRVSLLLTAVCFLSFSQNHLNLVVVNNVPLFFNIRDGPYMPTLRLLHQCEVSYLNVTQCFSWNNNCNGTIYMEPTVSWSLLKNLWTHLHFIYVHSLDQVSDMQSL